MRSANSRPTFADRQAPYAEMVTGIETAQEHTQIRQMLAVALFEAPFHDPILRDCFVSLLDASGALEGHKPKLGDTTIAREAVKLNAGFLRRFEILRHMSGGAGSKFSFRDLAGKLRNIASDGHRKYLLEPLDPDIAYLDPEYLAEAAIELHNDVQRTFRSMQDPVKRLEFNYWGSVL